jgi:hypothetical protein
VTSPPGGAMTNLLLLHPWTTTTYQDTYMSSYRREKQVGIGKDARYRWRLEAKNRAPSMGAPHAHNA